MSSRRARRTSTAGRRGRASRASRRIRGRDGFIVDQHRWKLSLLRDFVRRFGWEKLKPGTMVPPGVDLHRYVAHRRSDCKADRIAAWLVTECESIPGWSWSVFEDTHRRNLDNLRTFVRKHGWEALATKPVMDGARLDKWVYHRREEYKQGELDAWLVRGLEALPGWTWDPRRAGYERNLRALREYIAQHGWSSITAHFVTESGAHLGYWIVSVRALYRRGQLDAWVAAELERVPGWTWDPQRTLQAEHHERLAKFVAHHGWNAVKRELVVGEHKLGLWVANCRMRYRRGELLDETRRGLEAIPGWSWSGRPGPKGRK